MSIDKSQVRNAATVIVIRDRFTSPRILMGQRGAKAVFMPNKFVFPGGAVDAGDADIPLASAITDICTARLCEDGDPDLDLSDLSLEVSGHQGLAQLLHTVHIGLDAAPAVIPAASLPNGSTEVARGIHCIVPSDGSGRGGLPRFGVLAWW